MCDGIICGPFTTERERKRSTKPDNLNRPLGDASGN